MTELSAQDRQLCDDPPAAYDDLTALYINCTLKPSPQPSHTQALADRSIAIMRANGVEVDAIRAVDHHLAPGVQPDMTEHGADRDDWPALFERVTAADILVLLTAIWLGEKSSVATRVVERLYSLQHLGYVIRPRPTRRGSARRDPGLPTPTRGQAVRRTSSPTATPRS